MQPYTIQSGDTLSSIASRNKTSIPELLKLNPNITNPNVIQTGSTLNLSRQSPSAPTPSPASVSQTIGFNNLSNVQPYNIPQNEVQPNTTNLALSNNNFGSSILADLNPDMGYTASADRATLRTSLESIMKGVSGQSAEIEKIRRDSDLLGKKQRALAISNELDVLDKNFRDEVAQIKQNVSGGFGGNMNSLINAAQDKYQNNRANIALTYKVASQDYLGAEQLVQDKVESLRQSNADALKAYSLFADAINNDLTESEKLQVQANLTRKNNQAKTVEDAYLTVLGNASNNGAPASVLSAIDKASRQPNATPASIAIAAGKYGAKSIVTTKAPEVQKINGIDMQWNPTTSKWETITTSSDITKSTVPLAQAQSNVDQISTLLNDSAIRSAVGPTFVSRFVGRGLDTATGARQNFIASVEQIRSNLNLESLINAKARGATFGALSDQELRVLASSASKIGSWAIKDGDGNVVGYSASEKDFKNELDKINNFAKLDYIIRGGDPMDVNAQMQSDGSVWSKNSNGTLTRIK